MRYTDRLLDDLRRHGDPVPDGLVAALAERGKIEAVNASLRRLQRNDQPVPGELPDDLEGWLVTSARLPDWVDLDRLDRAAALFREHGLQMALILSTASLINCYAAAKGVKALTFTHRMRSDLYHRAAETAQFVLLVLAPGGLAEGGGGIRAIQKVRLIHASMRHIIRRGDWPEAELGVPLCQEDMLLALLTFSHDVVAGLRTLGVELSEDATEDFIYAWAVIGQLLGIQAEHIPVSMTEAVELRSLIARRQFAPTPEGIEMTAALIELHESVMPGDAFDGFLAALIRLLVGKQVADWMEVPRGRWDRIVRGYGRLGRYLDIIDRSSGTLGDLVDELAYRSLTRRALEATGYERAGFEIPAELGEVWSNRRAGGARPASA
jgi:hypothetical protein